MVPLWLWPLAIAAGNTFLLKPSEKDPGAAMLLAELALQAGLPKYAASTACPLTDTAALMSSLQGYPTILMQLSFTHSTPTVWHTSERNSIPSLLICCLAESLQHVIMGFTNPCKHINQQGTPMLSWSVHRGVLNVVHGTHGTVNRICDHPDIQAVSFVGSTAAGRYIYERAAKNGKRVQVILLACHVLSCKGRSCNSQEPICLSVPGVLVHGGAWHLN